MVDLFVKFILSLLILSVPAAAIAQSKFFATSSRGGAEGAKQNAQLTTINGEFVRMNACTASGMMYAPTHTQADTGGCVAVSPFPTGMVAAFNRMSCPSGWSAFSGAQGRFIVGAGTLGADSYAVGAIGGSARHTLTISEMPNHDHGIGIPGWTDSFVEYDYVQPGPGPTAGVNGDGLGPFLDVLPTGGGQPHENRPPYLSLLYCEKQ